MASGLDRRSFAIYRRGWRDPEKGEIRSKSGDEVETAASLPSVATDFESSRLFFPSIKQAF